MADQGGTELESLVVRLTGDASEYLSALKGMQESTEQVAQTVKQAAEGIESVFNSAAQAILGMGLKGLVDKATGEFDTMIRTQIDLKSALKASGQDVDRNLASLQDWAAGIQQVTELGDDAALAIATVGINMGLTAEKTKQASNEAIALAAASGVSEQAAIRLTAEMAKGDIARAQQFARMIPALRGVKDATEFQKKYHQLVAAGWKASSEKARTFTGQMSQLGNAFGDLFEEFGKVVADILTPFVDMGKQIVKWFQELNQNTKETIVAMTLLGTAMMAFPPIFKTIKTVFLSTFGPWGIVIAAIGLAINELVDYLGGFEAIWGVVKDAARTAFTYIQGKWKEFSGWMDPVWRALQSLGTTVWGMLKDAASSAFESIKGYWDSFVESFGGANFDQARDAVLDAVLAIEFGIRNLSDIASVVWAKAKLDFIVFADTVIQFFLSDIPEAAKWFANNFVEIHVDLFNFVTTGFLNLTENIGRNFVMVAENVGKLFTNIVFLAVEIFKNLPGLIKGTIKMDTGVFQAMLTEGVDWKATWKPLGEGFQAQLKELPKFVKREAGPLEQALRKEFEELSDKVGMNWQKFQESKKGDFAVAGIVDWLGGVIDNALTGIEGEGGLNNALGDTATLMKKTKDDATKVDAALRDSAEAASRIAATRDIGNTSNILAKREANQQLAAGRFNAQRDAPIAGALNAVKAAVENEAKKDREALFAILRAIEGGGRDANNVALDFANLGAG